jgi:microcystin-dependent protein
MAAHNHGVNCINGAGSANSVANAVWAAETGRVPPPLYAAAATPVNMNPAALTPTGGNLPHNNLSPFLGILFVIALSGNYPQRG